MKGATTLPISYNVLISPLDSTETTKLALVLATQSGHLVSY